MSMLFIRGWAVNANLSRVSVVENENFLSTILQQPMTRQMVLAAELAMTATELCSAEARQLFGVRSCPVHSQRWRAFPQL